MTAYITNLVLFFVGYYVVDYIGTNLLTGTDDATTLMTTLIPTMIVIAGAIYAVIAGIKLRKMSNAAE